MKKVVFLFTFVGFLLSCNTSKKINQPLTELRDLDTLVVMPEPEHTDPPMWEVPVYRASATRKHDLLHTKLELAFDWNQEKVIGKATLTLKPYFYESNKLVLDAVNFTFNEVSMANNRQKLKYDYDGQKLEITLDRSYKRDEEFKIYIDYIAAPSEGGGSVAINSDKGLYFINASGEEDGKPQQIWTQGETEANSKWFPTIDKPNERTTQEMYITVEDRFKTLSNGILMNSTKNNDGTRTDYWKMDMPHAPYLFMMAIGDFAKVEDKWRNIDVDYYVEPEYEADAKAIFPHTPEMLEFFSNRLGVDYPWQKYAQVVVRDFVSGAMENTTASIFGEFIQKHNDELDQNDDINQMIVAHEMFHQWFGDYVTCESWSNLTLNEGFANYSEYLWAEHKSGRDKADHHRYNEMNAYFNSAQNKIHDLIDFNYNDKEDMFDAHSYNKGGLILHMLRKYLGDDAFFAGLNKYLNDNKFTAVEADELRMAFEDTTGEDLNWFFNQWFFDKGHPSLDIDYAYDAESGLAQLIVEQTQNPDEMPAIFQLPVGVDIYLSENNVIHQEIFINQRRQVFDFPVSSEPKLINFDNEKMLLAEKAESKTVDNYLFQFNIAKNYLDRLEAMEALQYESSEKVAAMYEKALNDPYFQLRMKAIDMVDASKLTVIEKLKKIVVNDNNIDVKSAALMKIAETENPAYVALISNSLKNEKNTKVQGAALQALQKLDSKAALDFAKTIKTTNNGELIKAIALVFAESGDASLYDYYVEKVPKMTGFDAINVLESFATFATNSDLKTMQKVVDYFNNIGGNLNESPWTRFGSTNGLNFIHVNLMEQILDGNESTEMKNLDEKIINFINKIKEIETNPQLKMFYSNLPTKMEKKP